MTILLLFVTGTTMADIKKSTIDIQPQVCCFYPVSQLTGVTQLYVAGHLAHCVFSQGTAPMQVGGNRNAKNCPIGPDGMRDWSFGLFDCFSRGNLCTLDPDKKCGHSFMC